MQIVACLGTILAGTTYALAQCAPSWINVPGAPIDNGVFAFEPWDPDGPGGAPEVLVAVGNLLHAGPVQLMGAGIWNGSAWSSMAGGYIGGNGRCVSSYDPDGTGPLPAQPLAAGAFTHAGGQPVNGIARWDGDQWHGFGGGLSGGLSTALTAIQYGGDVFTAGPFTHAGGVPAHGIARWDGAWHALTDERASTAHTFFIHNGELLAGGYFLDPAPQFQIAGVLRYVNVGWVNVGAPPIRDTVYCMAAFRGKLVAGGFFDQPQAGAPGRRISILEGETWTPLGTGMNAPVRALTVFDPDGAGPLPELLIAGGLFTFAGGQPSPGIAAWDGNAWSSLGQGTNGPVYALEVFNGRLAVGGTFTTAGGLPTPYFALWGCPQGNPCYPNCDQSTVAPALNVADFTCFLRRFALGETYANCDQSTATPALTVADFTCFLQRFAAGCQ